MPSLSRFPFPEYHTNYDNISIIQEQSLDEYISVLEESVWQLENETMYMKLFKGFKMGIILTMLSPFFLF